MIVKLLPHSLFQEKNDNPNLDCCEYYRCFGWEKTSRKGKVQSQSIFDAHPSTWGTSLGSRKIIRKISDIVEGDLGTRASRYRHSKFDTTKATPRPSVLNLPFFLIYSLGPAPSSSYMPYDFSPSHKHQYHPADHPSRLAWLQNNSTKTLPTAAN